MAKSAIRCIEGKGTLTTTEIEPVCIALEDTGKGSTAVVLKDKYGRKTATLCKIGNKTATIFVAKNVPAKYKFKLDGSGRPTVKYL